MSLAGFSSINFAASLMNVNTAPGTGARAAMSTPRHKYTFIITMQVNPYALSALTAQTTVSQYIYNGKIYGQLKSIDYPKIKFDVETLRSYNRYRKINKKMMYDPATIIWHDDSTSMVSGLIKEYINFYSQTGNIGTPGGSSLNVFDDTQFNNEQGIVGDNVRANMNVRQSLGLNLRPQYMREFFEYITIYDLGTEPTAINTHTFHRPVITSFERDNLDWYQTDMVTTRWMFEYEGYYSTIGQNVDLFSDVMDLVLGGDSNS
jgi:hypothetical protein